MSYMCNGAVWEGGGGGRGPGGDLYSLDRRSTVILQRKMASRPSKSEKHQVPNCFVDSSIYLGP